MPPHRPVANLRSARDPFPALLVGLFLALPLAATAQIPLHFPGQVLVNTQRTSRDVLGLDYDGDARDELLVGHADGVLTLMRFRSGGNFDILENLDLGGEVTDLALLAVAPADTVLVVALANADEIVLVDYQGGAVPLTVRDRCSLDEDPGTVATGGLGGTATPGIVVNLPGTDAIAILVEEASTWVTQQVLATGDTPSSPVLIDLDGDGVNEIITADSGALSGSLSVFRWSEGAGYALSAQPAGIGVPRALLAYDHDADETAELFVSYTDSAFVSIMEPQAGALVEVDRIPTPLPTDGMRIAPVAEAELALVCWNAERGTVHYFRRSLQDWEFVESFYTGGRASGVALLDMNFDSYTDLAVANGTSGTVALLFGNSLPSFRGYQARLLRGLPFRALALDADGDTKLDVVVSDFDNAELSVLRGLGNGRLEPDPTPLVLEAGVSDLVALRADGDEHVDLAGVQTLADRVRILRALGDGHYVEHASFVTGDAPVAATAADFDGDGIVDIVVGNAASDDLTVAFGAGDGTFPETVTVPVTRNVEDVCWIDLNGDELPDLAVASGQNGVQTYTNLGNGVFGQNQFYEFGAGASVLAAADFDGDLDDDLVAADNDGQTLAFLENLGNGRLSVRGGPRDLGRRPGQILPVDVDADDLVDVIVSFPDESAVGIVVAFGDWSYSPPILFYPALVPGQVLAGDYNGDLITDLVVLDRALDLVVTMLNIEPNPLPLEAEALTAVCGAGELEITLETVGAAAWRLEVQAPSGWILLGDDARHAVGDWRPWPGGWRVVLAAAAAADLRLASGAGAIPLRLVRSVGGGTRTDAFGAPICWETLGERTPAALRVGRPFPNPFNPRVEIPFALERAGRVEVAVWDLRGRRIATIADRVLPAGEHRLLWHGLGARGPVAAGTYVVTVSVADRREARKIVLVR